MRRWAEPLGLLALVVACGNEPRVPATSVVPVAVPPMPVASGQDPSAATTCDEHDPTPDALPTAPAPPAFTQLDAEIRQMQSRPGKYVYTGSVADVLGDGKGTKGAFQLDAEEAVRLARRLEKEVVEKGDSPEWSVVARTRDAEMFERLRDGLVNTTVHLGSGPPPLGHITLMTPQQVHLLTQMQMNARPGAVNPGSLQDAVLDFWNQKKKQEVDGANERIIDRYARAASFADTKNPAAARAVRRLAHYTSEIGDKNMARILGREYTPNMYRAACVRLSESSSN